MQWSEKVDGLRCEIGRDPSLDELLELARDHQMTLAEIDAQRQSFARSMMPSTARQTVKLPSDRRAP